MTEISQDGDNNEDSNEKINNSQIMKKQQEFQPDPAIKKYLMSN